MAEAALQSALGHEGSRIGSASGHRPGSANSSFRSVASSPSGGQRNKAAGPFPEIPKMAIKNPLAQKIGGTTGDLAEYNGAFSPLQSQSKIPDYDALYDPHLKSFWGRNDVAKVMKLEGKTRDLFAPDSGMLEAAISDELNELRRSRDIAEVVSAVPPAPLLILSLHAVTYCC